MASLSGGYRLLPAKLSMDAQKVWDEMQATYLFGLGDAALHHGTHSCFCLRLSDHIVKAEDSVLIKATVDDAAQLRMSSQRGIEVSSCPQHACGGKVILRATFQDFDILLRHVTEVKVMQAYVQHRDGVTILDATATPCFFNGKVATQAHEVLQIAQIFSGGFAGWSRAVASLRDGGVPVHTSWILERDPACWTSLHAMDPELHTACSCHDLLPAIQPHDTILIAEDFRAQWWRKAVHLRPTDIAVVSPPCQPWSSAGNAAGLHSPDGRLLLEVVEFLSIAPFEVAIFEEVDGFARHKHFGVFYQAMREAGYVCQWRAPLQLAELAPASRKRYFLIFVREHRYQSVDFQARHWRALGFPSMSAAQAFFPHLPRDLLQPCLLDPSTMDMYMSPSLLPRGPQGRRPVNVRAARVRAPTEQATCFLAQYHYQHQLPAELLQRNGLLGTLLETPDGLRFYAAPEIAASQGANGVFLIPRDDRTAMRILGNSLSTYQAAFVLGLALQNFPDQIPHLDAAVCVEWCQEACMRYPVTLLLEVDAGWMMCHIKCVSQALAQQAVHEQIQAHLLPAEHSFRAVQVAAGTEQEAIRFQLHISQHLSDSEATAALHLSPDLIVPAAPPLPTRFDCADAIHFGSLPEASCKIGRRKCVVAWADNACFVMCRGVPDFYHQLRQVFEVAIQSHKGKVLAFDMAGAKLTQVATLPDMLVVCAPPSDVFAECFYFDEPTAAQARPVPGEEGVAVQITCDAAPNWYLSYPCHLLTAVGWATSFSSFPTSADQQLIIHACPTRDSAFSTVAVRQWLRDLSFLAPLRVADELCKSDPTCTTAVQVEVQVERRTLWTGSLPDQLTFAQLEHMWVTACQAFGLSPAARIFSGPCQVQQDVTLGAFAIQASHKAFRRSAANLLLTVVPFWQGGGAKDDKLQNLKAKLAQACLEQGYTLTEVNRASALLTQQVPHNKLQQALDARPAAEQWQQLKALLQAHGVAEPAQGEVSARIAQRVQAQVRKKSLFQDTPKAANFSLASGFFLNADGSHATILRRIAPNTSGVVLLDREVAESVIRDYSQECPHELAIVSIGHQCPHKASCSQAVHFPAYALGADGQGHDLLAGCVHNLGGRKITTSVRNVDAVDIASTTPCTFQAFADEWDASPSWQEVTNSPVKLLLSDFRQSGVPLNTVQPWGRTFKCQGRMFVSGHPLSTGQYVSSKVLVPINGSWGPITTPHKAGWQSGARRCSPCR